MNTVDAGGETHTSRWNTAIAAVLTVGGFIIAVAMGLASDGVYHDDDICHYLFAHDSWTNVKALLHVWARPGYNLPTAVAAHFFGMVGCRIFSALQTAGVAWLSYLIARKAAKHAGLGKTWPILAPALVWLQPLTMTLALTTLTETTAALYMALGLWLFIRGNRLWSCAAFSAMFVTRYETMALAPIIVVAIAYESYISNDRRLGKAMRQWWVWACAAALAWAPLLYAAAATVAKLPPNDSPLSMFSRDYTREYGSGAIYHFLSIWPQASGLAILSAMVAGTIALGRRAVTASALTFALVALHSLLFWKGCFATGGYARFLVPLSAPVAVLASGGLAGVWRACSRLVLVTILLAAGGFVALVLCCWPFLLPMQWQDRRGLIALTVAAPLVVAALAAITANDRTRRIIGQTTAVSFMLLAIAQASFQVHPLSLTHTSDNFHSVIARAVHAIDESEYRDNPAITQHVLIRFLRPDKTKSLLSNNDALTKWRNAPPGTLFFWENKYCYKPHEMQSTLELYDELQRLGRCVQHSEYKSAQVRVFLRTTTENKQR